MGNTTDVTDTATTKESPTTWLRLYTLFSWFSKFLKIPNYLAVISKFAPNHDYLDDLHNTSPNYLSSQEILIFIVNLPSPNWSAKMISQVLLYIFQCISQIISQSSPTKIQFLAVHKYIYIYRYRYRYRYRYIHRHRYRYAVTFHL